MERNSIKQLLMASNYFVLNKKIVKRLGIETAFLFSVLVEADNTLADEEGWFYQTVENLEEFTGLSKYKQGLCLDKLIELDILEQKNKGIPMKRFFKINYSKLQNYIFNNETEEKISHQEVKKFDNLQEKNLTSSSEKISHNKENNNKKNNINKTTTTENQIEIEKESSQEKSSSSSLSDEKDKIKDLLYQHGLDQATINNILKLDKITLTRVKIVLSNAVAQKWNAGAIYLALKENWNCDNFSSQKIAINLNLTEKEARKKIVERTNYWLDYYQLTKNYECSRLNLINDFKKFSEFQQICDEYLEKFEKFCNK